MDVLRKLRIKMIASIVAVIMLVLAAIFLTLDFSLTKAENDKSIQFLSQLAMNDGHLPRLRNGMPGPRMDDGNDPKPPDINNEKLTAGGPRPPDLADDKFSGGAPQSPNGGIPERTDKDNGPVAPPDRKDGGNSIFSWFHIDSFNVFRNYFSVRTAADGTVKEIIRDFPLSFTDSEITEMTAKIFSLKRDKGIYNVMAYLVCRRGETSLLCVMNRQSEMSTLYQVYSFTGIIYCISLFVAFLLAWLLSLWSVKPVAAAFDKQKRFIADAGHELKTPIAVIGANIDVLLSDMPENKWLQYIRDENERMSHLVKDLLFLARNDADRSVMHLSHFDFTAAVNSAVLPFESVIFEQEKKLELSVSDGLKFYGDESQLKQVIIVLVDNAIKNSDSSALIRVKAYQESQKIILTVYNTGRGIAKSDLEKIFLRFYRADTSRARQTGGYGLGLAIAKTITEAHGGTLTADSLYGQWAEFTLSLPLNFKNHME